MKYQGACHTKTMAESLQKSLRESTASDLPEDAGEMEELTCDLDPSTRLVSMMEQKCRSNDCLYLCSVYSYPYCHQCKAARKRGGNVSIHGIHTLKFGIDYETRECATRNCEYRGCKSSNWLCSICYKNSAPENLRSSASSHAAEGRHIGGEMSESDEWVNIGSHKTSGETSITCFAPNCWNVAEIGLHGLCANCFAVLRESKQERAVQNQPGEEHKLRVMLPPEKPAHVEETRKPLYGGASANEHSGPCKIKGCKMRGNAERDFLCSRCYTTYHSHEETSSRWQKWRPKDVPGNFRPCASGCKKWASPETFDLCSDCFKEYVNISKENCLKCGNSGKCQCENLCTKSTSISR